MMDASTAQGQEPNEPTGRKPFFPEEGAFNTVVPLSQVGLEPVSKRDDPDAGQPAEAVWALEDRRVEGRVEDEDEATLVHARGGDSHAAERAARGGTARQPWGVTALVIALSTFAGVAAGSYLVWSKRPVEAVTHAPSAAGHSTAGTVLAPAAEPTPPPASAQPAQPDAPAPAATSTEDAETAANEETAAEPDAKVETASTANAPRTTPPPAAPRAASPEPAAARAAETRPREERAAAAAREARPAPRVARTETPAPRTTARAEKRPPIPVLSGRTLPVSSPPASAKPRTVIQWP